MSTLLVTLLFVSLISRTLASPYAHILESRNDASSSSKTPTINATISDRAGNDLTSSFQVMLYNEPEVVAEPNLTGRAMVALSRPISGCAGLETRGAQFVRSWCTAKDAGGTMQTYSYQCKVRGDSITQTHRRNSRCDDEEICLDGKGGGKRKGGRMAYCVSKDSFVQFILRGEFANAEPRMTLGGRKAAVLLSETDGATPLEADTLGIEAGNSAGNGQVPAVEGTAGQSNQCRDCIELNMDALAPKTDYLKTEATLLTTGAAMGIMWLAVMSG